MLQFRAILYRPPVPPTVTLTGIVNVYVPVEVMVCVPLIDGVLPVCPLMTTLSPFVNPWANGVVITVGFAIEEDVILDAIFRMIAMIVYRGPNPWRFTSPGMNGTNASAAIRPSMYTGTLSVDGTS